MRRWIIFNIILAILLFLAVGGLYMSGVIKTTGSETAEVPPPPPPPPPTLPVLPDVAYMELRNVILPAVRDGKFRNYINFTFRLEVKDALTVESLRSREAHMRAALVSAFSVQPIETRVGPADFEDAPFRARVLQELRKAAGDESSIQDVLIGRVLPIRG